MSLLTRHILVELLKVMLLTAGVLVTVIAFGAAVGPLARDLLGPIDAVRYITLVMVPMLQFALPFAAGFAATMVLHRMVTDNELLAMSVSGLSYRRIFTPVGWLALLIAVTMLLLVNYAVPRFWTMAQATVARDFARLFVNRIGQGSAFEAGNLHIHADAIAQDALPPDAAELGVTGRLRLAGVAAVRLDGPGQPSIEFTAELATVDIYRDEEGVYLKPSLVNATVYRAEDGTLAFMPRAVPEAIRLHDPVRRGPKYMTFTEIMRVRHEPERLPAVRDRRRQLERTVREVRMWESLDAALRAGRSLTLSDPLGRATYVVDAAGVDGTRLVAAPGGHVRITELVGGRAIRIAEAPWATLEPDAIGRDGERLAVDLLVADAAVRVVAEGVSVRRWPPRISGLRLADEPGADLHLRSLDELRTEAAAIGDGPGPGRILRGRAAAQMAQIDRERERVATEIRARLSQRVAVSLAAPLVLLLGATLAAWRRNAAPLAIYAIAFMPAVADILLIAGGEQMMKDGRLVGGLTVMWSGNALMAACVIVAWLGLRRN